MEFIDRGVVIYKNQIAEQVKKLNLKMFKEWIYENALKFEDIVKLK